MARKSIRDFSGGLVSYQSEFDISDNQFQTFDNIINTKRGSVVSQNATENVSSAISAGVKATTELVRYRTEKDGSNADKSTEWWAIANGLDVYRQDSEDGTSGTFASINTYALGTECVANGALTSSTSWSFGTGWSFNLGEPPAPNYVRSTGVVGALTQTNANMTIKLEKHKTYKMQFTVSDISGGSKVDITIQNQALTETYLSTASYTATTNTVYFSPPSSNGGLGILSGTSAGSSTNSYTIKDVTIKEVPNHDLFVHNQILRISDGNFLSSNDPKWYGHIKRNVFGQSFIYTDAYKFRKPPMAVAVNEWKAESTALTAPTVVPMTYVFDQQDAINAANKVGIYVNNTNDSGNDLIGSVTAGTFNAKDKYTVTFLYDYIQESELGRDANGDIGVFSQNPVHTSRCPGLQLVLYTGTDLASWNKRITGINLYWQPADDVDWYLISTYDVDKGFSEDPRAKDTASTVNIRGGINSYTNSGFWIPCLEPYTPHTDNQNTIQYTNSTASVISSDTGSWSSGFSSNKIIAVTASASGGTATLAEVAAKLEIATAYVASIKTVSSALLTTGYSSTTVQWGGWLGAGYVSDESADVYDGFKAYAFTMSTDKVATWYIPNDGLKLATYNSLTGRAAETRLKTIGWGTSTVVGNKAFYANIDFEDENEQTLREKNRIVFTDNFKLDEAVVGTKYVDVGKNDGDEIVALESAQGRLYVLKSRNIYIYRIRSAQSVNFTLERHIPSVGTMHKHAVTETPYGLCVADKKQISLLSGTELSELSLLIRDTYQALTFNPGNGDVSLGYDGRHNMLIANIGTVMYGYNFDTQSWAKLSSDVDTLQSNMILNDNQNVQVFDTTSKRVENIMSGAQGGDSPTLLLKTKRFDFGLPDQFKRFTKLHVTYLSSGIPYFKVYIDGNSTSEGQIGMAAHSTLTTYSAVVNELGKTIEIEVYGSASNFRIDGIDIDYDIEGNNP